MKNIYIIIITLLSSLFFACEKQQTPKAELKGKWELQQRELFVQDSLNGSFSYDEPSVFYEFRTDGTNSGELIISEDGLNESYSYSLENETFITTTSFLNFKIEQLTTNELTLSQTYSNNRSVYYFGR
ncbi:MAG: hypothetical protein MI810_20770 [Flavobacteriales bacterium]|nr:hypothetical protein [Flavobacteriales bacterium]